MELTAEQLRILRHTLGINDARKRDPVPYRNHYCANPGDSRLHELAKLGMMRRVHHDPRLGLDQYESFACTEAGIEAAKASQRAMMWSKSKRVYHTFLEISDFRDHLTFKQFLTDPEFAETRARA